MTKKILSVLMLAIILAGLVVAIVHDRRPVEFVYVIVLSAIAGAVIFGFHHLSPRMQRKGMQFSLIELFLVLTAIALVSALVRISMSM